MSKLTTPTNLIENPPTLKVEIQPKPDFWSDVMVTATDGAYGGIWYWADSTKSPEGNNALECTKVVNGHDVDEHWIGYWIRTKEATGSAIWDDKVFYSPYRVTWKTLAVGMEYLLAGKDANGRSLPLSDHLVRGVVEQDAGEIDSDLADVIVQLGVFGEVVFG